MCGIFRTTLEDNVAVAAAWRSVATMEVRQVCTAAGLHDEAMSLKVLHSGVPEIRITYIHLLKYIHLLHSVHMYNIPTPNLSSSHSQRFHFFIRMPPSPKSFPKDDAALGSMYQGHRI